MYVCMYVDVVMEYGALMLMQLTIKPSTHQPIIAHWQNWHISVHMYLVDLMIVAFF